MQRVVGTAIVERAHDQQRLEMRGNGAPRRKVSARRGDMCPTRARQQRTQKKNGPAQPSNKSTIRSVSSN